MLALRQREGLDGKKFQQSLGAERGQHAAGKEMGTSPLHPQNWILPLTRELGRRA